MKATYIESWLSHFYCTIESENDFKLKICKKKHLSLLLYIIIIDSMSFDKEPGVVEVSTFYCTTKSENDF